MSSQKNFSPPPPPLGSSGYPPAAPKTAESVVRAPVGGGLASAVAGGGGVTRQAMSAASSALPAVVQSADQAFTSTSSVMNAGNAFINSFPFEDALEWSQQMSKERQKLKDNPAAQCKAKTILPKRP